MAAVLVLQSLWSSGWSPRGGGSCVAAPQRSSSGSLLRERPTPILNQVAATTWRPRLRSPAADVRWRDGAGHRVVRVRPRLKSRGVRRETDGDARTRVAPSKLCVRSPQGNPCSVRRARGAEARTHRLCALVFGGKPLLAELRPATVS